ncbi:MAG: cytochrome d ubiquinol oxidase subunit II [Deltaproteobacteria bacterium]|nr:cytochrome d ubiquinol oxidase subunit II [Deltaproteobacteria bacterium]
MLETTWFVLWGVLWAVYFMLDGFDLGLGVLQRFLPKDETEKRIIYSIMGPVWDGNEVWLITAGGVTFAAFPKTYAVMFSSLYSALLLLLFALIIRAVALEFRGQVDSPAWRKLWDNAALIGSFLPALLLGVAFANIFKGIPINEHGVNQGSLCSLLNPYGLAGGVLFVLLFLLHGALWLAVRTTNDFQARAVRLSGRLWSVLLVVAVLFLALSRAFTNLWTNYINHPVLLLIPFGAVCCLLWIRISLARKNCLAAWVSSAGVIVLCTLFGVVGLYPNLLPSSLNPDWSMSIYNSSSSPLTLKIMLGVALVFVPLVIIYQFMVYRFFSYKVTRENVAEEVY